MQLEKLLDDLPGIPAGEALFAKQQVLHQLLVDEGHELTLQAVRKWFERESIPGRWWMRIAAHPVMGRKKIDLREYT